MTVPGFLRASAPGTLLLLLAFTSSTPLVQRAGAYSSELTNAKAMTGGASDGAVPIEPPILAAGGGDDDDASGCSTELDACLADTTCHSCLSASSSSTATLACRSFDPQTTSASGCDLNLDAICCLDGVSDFDCRGIDEYLAYGMCILEEGDCGVDKITCDDDEESTAETEGGAAGASRLGDEAKAIASSSLAVASFFACVQVVAWPLLWA